MKKTLLILCVCSLMGTFFSSCKKSLLDITNPNTLTVDQFWKTEADAQAGINSAYAMFYKPGLWSRWMYFRLDLVSDEGFSNSPWLELADWTRFQYTNYNFWEGNVITWRDTYKAVFRCNQVLASVPQIEFDAAKKAQILAQAKFLRAVHYYYAELLWENIPLILEPSKVDDVPAQNTPVEVWAQIQKDLTEAMAVLPVNWDDANKGRPTKGSAAAFLAKALMQQRKWSEAKIALDYFITGEGKGKYALTAKFSDNFRHTSENNSESVFEVQFSEVNTGGDGDAPNATMSTNRPQFFAPRTIGWSDGQARFWTVAEFKKEKTTNGSIDSRLRYTLFYPELEADFGDKTYGRSWAWNNNECWFKKYSRDYFRNNEDYFCQNNLRMIRYADVLLMYAEVLNELGQTNEAYAHVDQVRARSAMGGLATSYPAIGTNKDAFRSRLKTERLLELCGESVRWADLKRWGDLDTQAGVDAITLRDPDFKNFVVGKHIRLPLPQQEVLNNTKLKQNANY